MLTPYPSDLARVACVAKVSDRKHIKIFTPKEMLQRFPIALAQIKTGNTSENLLNEIKKLHNLCTEQNNY